MKKIVQGTLLQINTSNKEMAKWMNIQSNSNQPSQAKLP